MQHCSAMTKTLVCFHHFHQRSKIQHHMSLYKENKLDLISHLPQKVVSTFNFPLNLVKILFSG